MGKCSLCPARKGEVETAFFIAEIVCGSFNDLPAEPRFQRALLASSLEQVVNGAHCDPLSMHTVTLH